MSPLADCSFQCYSGIFLRYLGKLSASLIVVRFSMILSAINWLSGCFGGIFILPFSDISRLLFVFRHILTFNDSHLILFLSLACCQLCCWVMGKTVDYFGPQFVHLINGDLNAYLKGTNKPIQFLKRLITSIQNRYGYY